jgi:peptide/nickel transport system substrate-binding protein
VKRIVPVAAVGFLLLGACSPPTTTDGESGQTGSPNTLVVATSSQLKTLDPGRTLETTGVMIHHHLYDTLLTFDGDDLSTPVPAVAASYTMDDDASTFTFEIRDDITFNNGDPLDASDVEFTLDRVLNLDSNATPLLAGVSDVTATDEYTVVIETEEPDPALPYKLTQPPLGVVNADVVEENGGSAEEGAATADEAENFLNGQSAGTGPYQLVRWTRGSEVVMEKNPNYWGEEPSYDQIVIRDTDVSAQGPQVAGGTVDLALDLNAEQAGQLRDVDVHSFQSPSFWWILLNGNPDVSAVTADENFREAVWYGVDYEAVMQRTTGTHRVAGIIPPNVNGSLPADVAVERDLERAKEALGRSGYGGEAIQLTYPSDVQIDGIAFGDLATVVQSGLKEVGINVELNPQPTQTALDSYRAGEQPMGLWQTMIGEPHPNGYLVWFPGTEGNYMAGRAGWQEAPEIAEIAAAARAETDQDAAAEMYAEIQDLMLGNAPVVPLFVADKVFVSSTSLEGVEYNPVWVIDLTQITSTDPG